jgi:hypothetical protein
MPSQELRDLRAKITVETDAVLDSLAGGRGVERSEIVRDVLHRWALSQIAEIPAVARLLLTRLKAEGIGGEDARSHKGVAAQQ